MKSKLVCCPYCGGEMELERCGKFLWYYACKNEGCGAFSPIGRDGEEAYQKARPMNRPPLRPLTREEAQAHIAKENCRPLYLEMKNKDADKFCEIAGMRWRSRAYVNHLLEYCTYGAKMRLWPDEPTAEERAAAEWEEASEKIE